MLEKCNKCSGHGKLRSGDWVDPGPVIDCYICKGTGKVTLEKQYPDGNCWFCQQPLFYSNSRRVRIQKGSKIYPDGPAASVCNNERCQSYADSRDKTFGQPANARLDLAYQPSPKLSVWQRIKTILIESICARKGYNIRESGKYKKA